MNSSLRRSITKFAATFHTSNYKTSQIRPMTRSQSIVGDTQMAPLHTAHGLFERSGVAKPKNAKEYGLRVNEFFDLNESGSDSFTTSHLLTAGQNSIKAAYGGLIFSQALMAAERTVETQMKPHAMHSFFILNVDSEIPIEYRVRRLRDGRSFCTRTVEAIQKDKVCFCLQVSFHVMEADSCIHQSKFPDVPSPEECVTSRDFALKVLKQVEDGEVTVTDLQSRRLTHQANRDPDEDLFEMRCTTPSSHLGLSETPKERTMFYWFKTRFPVLSDNERVHRFLIAYQSDACLAGTAVKPHLSNGFDFSMLFSLDHSLWFHESDTRADQWLLYECHSTKSGHGRGFTEGRLWTRDGQLVMSSAQECLVRTKTGVSKI